MNIIAVAEELRAHGAAITPLAGRSYVGPPGSVTDPCLIVPLPEEITFDQVYGRGQDMLLWEIIVIVGRSDDRQIMERIGQYCAGSGPLSVKQALEGGAPYTACGDVFVASAELATVTWQGTDFQGAFFSTQIRGRGLS